MIFDPEEIDSEYMSRSNWLKRLLYVMCLSWLQFNVITKEIHVR